MFRFRMQDLLAWKGSESRKPLIIRGPRQVGKTWLMQEFGKLHYQQTVYLNFEKTPRLQALFTGDFNVEKISMGLHIETGSRLDPGNTLIILDEIQSCPEALTALKFFKEEAPEYQIVAAGSLLGVALQSKVSFPVGSVSFLDLGPMIFPEFLLAMGEEGLYDLLKLGNTGLINGYRDKFLERLRQYYFVGGMPAAVAEFSLSADFQKVRERQREILDAYELDYSKHAPIDKVPRIRMVWNSVPGQLAKENKKFIYGQLKSGARAKEFELALAWLSDCGQVTRVFRVSKPGFPLKGYEDPGAFKLFIADIGLLVAMTDINPDTLLNGNALFTEFKGAITEQFVLQQIRDQFHWPLYYWSADQATSEVDFVFQASGAVYPLEVKAEENLKARSLKVYRDKFKPLHSFRTSTSDLRRGDSLTNIPLFALSILEKFLTLGHH